MEGLCYWALAYGPSVIQRVFRSYINSRILNFEDLYLPKIRKGVFVSLKAFTFFLDLVLPLQPLKALSTGFNWYEPD